MLKKLFEDLFEKVKGEDDLNTISKNSISIYFVEIVLEERYKKINYISAKALIGYYEKYVEKKNNKSGEPKSQLKNLISQYLGYDDFQDFKNKNSKKKKSFNIKNAFFTVPIILISSLATFFFVKTDTISCIEWNNNHYEIIDCNGNYPNPLLKDVDIDNFKKLKITKTSTFYKFGKPIIWYGKNKEGNGMDFFNSRGIHPETYKELKPITPYIINKYIDTIKKSEVY